MKPPAKADGSPMTIVGLMDGSYYVDAQPAMQRSHATGPWSKPHHHRYEDYGLTDGWLRCRFCGRLTLGGNSDPS